jgi:tetratricopeptide (TPR) repeat protein
MYKKKLLLLSFCLFWCVQFLFIHHAYARLDGNPTLLTAIEDLLQERYDVADQRLDSLVLAYPNDPAPYFFKGVLFWRKSSFLEDRTKYENQGILWWNKTLTICNSLLEQHPNDAYLLFYKGGTHGLIGTVQVKNFNFFKAGINAIKGIRNLEDAFEADSTYWDTYYGLGLYHMTAANMPGIVKFLQRLLPIPAGDQEKAYRYLKISITKGQFAPFMARALLSFSYTYYNTQYDSAFAYLAPVLQYYSENTSVLVFAANTYFHHGMNTGATDWKKLQELLALLDRRIAERGEQLEIYYREKYLLVNGIAAFRLYEDDMAIHYLDSLVTTYPKSDFAGLAWLTLGALADLNGDRAKAIKYYHNARDKKQLGEMEAWLKIYLKQPFQDPNRVLQVGNIFDMPDHP